MLKSMIEQITEEVVFDVLKTNKPFLSYNYFSIRQIRESLNC